MGVQETLATCIKRHFSNLSHTTESFILLPDTLATAGASSLTVPVTISGSSCRRESVRYHQAMNKVGTTPHKSDTGFDVLVLLTAGKNCIIERDAFLFGIYVRTFRGN